MVELAKFFNVNRGVSLFICRLNSNNSQSDYKASLVPGGTPDWCGHYSQAGQLSWDGLSRIVSFVVFVHYGAVLLNNVLVCLRSEIQLRGLAFGSNRQRGAEEDTPVEN